MASKLLSTDQENFIHLGQVCIDLLKIILKDILKIHIEPKKLHAAISSCPTLTTGKYQLRSDQRKICFIPPPSVSDYEKFDVSLLYTLIRNLCPSLKPTQGWGKNPTSRDIQIGDDIERLRLFRNGMFAHLDSTAVPNTVFTTEWNNLKIIIPRTQVFVRSNGISADYERELEKIDRSDFGLSDMEKYKTLLNGILCILNRQENEEFPRIKINGEDRVVCGKMVLFEAKVDHPSKCLTCTIIWQRVRHNGTDRIVTSAEKYKDSTSRELVIQKVSKEDEGEYQAFIPWVIDGQTHNITSNSIFLKPLGEKPTLEKLNVTTGTVEITLHYKYKVTGNSPEVDLIAWTRNGDTLNIDQKKYVGGGLLDTYLRIISPTCEDRGTYTCTVANAVGEVSESLLLGVPEIQVQGPEKTEKGNLLFIATIHSFPAAFSVQWSKKNKDNDGYTPIDVNVEEYKGTSNSLPHPVLITTQVTLVNKIFKIEAQNVIGINSKYVPDDCSPPRCTSLDNKVNRLPAIYSKGGSQIIFNNLRIDLIKEIPDSKLQSLKTSLKVISWKEISVENIKTVEDFFTVLYDEGIFIEHDVIMMQYLLRSIKPPDLEFKCVEYARKNYQCYFEETEPLEDGCIHVQLHVVDDVENYSDSHSLLTTVAAIVGCDKACIKVVSVRRETSFIIVISMNEKYARILEQKGSVGLTRLLKYKVDWIKVGKNTINIAQECELNCEKLNNMASGPNPSDRARFAKLGMAILEELTQACRDVLEIEVPPGLVHKKMKASSNYKYLRPEQEKKLLCAKNSGYEDFDITILYTLIRNFCSTIPFPTKGKWGGDKMPAAGEITIGDDIERIRLVRNSIYGHKSSFSIPQKEFDDTWSIITDVCRRLETYTKKDYMFGLNNIQSQALEEEYVNNVIEKLEEDYKNNKTLMDMIFAMEEKVLEKVSSVEQHVLKLKSKSDIEKKVDPTERRPTDKELMRVTTHIGSDFNLIGIGLGLTSTTIEQIRLNYQGYGVRTQIFQILVFWRMKEGKQATVDKFLETIKEFKGKIDFEDIEKVFGP